jgi:glycyl-tRNA synthetase beta chain
MSSRPLLLEIGCEELPSSSLRQLGEGLHQSLLKELSERKLTHGSSSWFATPRRLAVLVSDLAEKAPDQERESLGPPLTQARDDDGNWTRAAQGFAARCGVAPEDLAILDTPKGQRLGLRVTETGAATHASIHDVVASAVQALPIAKRMRWGAGPIEFARPVHWVVMLYGQDTGFGPVLGIDSGRVSFGHRFHAPEAISVPHADDYLPLLREARVVADFDERCEMIRAQVNEVAAGLNATAVIDAHLLEEVASLVEWPVALSGRFDEDFLEVPAEALISSMQSHQKYFPVLSNTEGEGKNQLQPYFITVSNIESRDPQQIVAGNERVIRPRLADAAFFYRQDLRHRLDSHLGRLDDVVYQKQLGSLGDRACRLEKLAGSLATVIAADESQARRAALLCKADLVTEMVQEFADMQGIAGSYYAANDEEDPSVAAAIREHYWPLVAGSELPVADVSRCVALADRLDTLVGIFGIGQLPSGSRDPFGLRRASIAVLRLLIEGELPVDLRAALSIAAAGFPPDVLAADTVDQVLEYALDRLPALYERDAIPVEVFRAVRASGVTVPVDLARRIHAVQAFRDREEAEALAAANKRVANILAKVAADHEFSEVSDNLLKEPAEKRLWDALRSAAAANLMALEANNYSEALSNLAALRSPVDAFFDDVMVNAEEPDLRNNRLNLLKRLRSEFLAIADISQLAG